MFKILCLDGGGAKGYFTAYMLNKIEEEYNIKINEYFDLIVGTSTGALIAGGLGADVPISEMVEIYLNENSKIFEKKKFNVGVFSSIYSNDYLKNILKFKYKGLKLKDCKTKIMITATDVINKDPILFKSWEDTDISILDAVISSSSAPLYFDPHKLNEKYYSDGCLWANNPSLVALSEVLSKDYFKNINLNEIKLLSIGTGINTKSIQANLNKSWGFFSWGKDLLNLTMQTNVKCIDDMTKKILKDNYLRIDYETDETGMSNIPKIALEQKDKIFEDFKESIEMFFAISNDKPKYNFIQKIAKKIFKI